MSDFRLRRVRSTSDISSRSHFEKRNVHTISQIASVKDNESIGSIGSGHYYGAYLYRQPYMYRPICPPYNYYRRDYPGDGTNSDPFPTWPRSASTYRNPQPLYPSTYSSYHRYSHAFSPISYSRYWSDHYYRPYTYLF